MKTKAAFLRIPTALIIAGLILWTNPLEAMSGGLENIEADFESGKLTLTEKLTLKALMVTDPVSLPPRYRIDRPLKDGTLLVLDIIQNWGEANDEFKRRFSFLLYRVDKQADFDSPSGFFRIHYDTTGGDAVYQPDVDIDPTDGIPDFVNRTAEYFDLAWHYICDTLGYDTPPYDGSRGGGENLYDIYMHRYAGAYGVTFLEFPSDQRPGRDYDYTSYIYVDPTYEGFGYEDRTLPMKVTSAHEFFHAVQFAYSVQAGDWYMENSATWMEDIIWDDINDNYAYLPYFLNHPHLALTYTNGAHEYGGFIWPMFLYENWGHEFILSSWNYAIHYDAETALELTCSDYGTSFPEQYTIFSLWNYLTNYRDDGNHYEEGSDYTSARTMRTHTNYPVYDMTSISRPTALGCNYVLFTSEGYEGNLHIVFDGDDGKIWYLQIIRAVADDSHVYDIFEIDAANDGEYIVEDFGQYRWVALVTDLVQGTSGDYIYSAFLEPTELDHEEDAAPSGFVFEGNYPNPFNGRTTISLLSPIEGAARLEIFDVQGRRIVDQDLALSLGKNRIPVRLDEGSNIAVASGVYYFRIIFQRYNLEGRMLYLK
jgi:hypothetical protein